MLDVDDECEEGDEEVTPGGLADMELAMTWYRRVLDQDTGKSEPKRYFLALLELCRLQIKPECIVCNVLSLGLAEWPPMELKKEQNEGVLYVRHKQAARKTN